MERLLQHRFDQGSLAGHTVGNVLIGAMNDLSGDFRTAIRQLSRVLAVRGQVLPSVLEQVALRAELVDGSVVEGESRIGAVTTRIKRVELVPADSEPPPAAVKSLREADVVVIGPGSLYTSILPNLLVRELCAALVNSDALKLYVCNVMTQPGETEGYSAAAHLQALTDHVGENFLDHIIVNGEPISSALRERYAEEGAEPVQVDTAALLREGVQPVEAPVVDQANYVRHDPVRLGEVIMRLVLQSEKALRRLSVFDIHLLQERYSVLRRERAK
jgi:uncharacterized cofD-like protein